MNTTTPHTIGRCISLAATLAIACAALAFPSQALAVDFWLTKTGTSSSETIQGWPCVVPDPWGSLGDWAYVGYKIYGKAGNDKVYGCTYEDKLYGGSGSDTVSGSTGRDIIFANEPTPPCTTSCFTTYRAQYLEYSTNWLYGGGDNDHVCGGGGTDHIWGDGGHDILEGGAGNDSMSGGGENDTFYGDAGNDTIYAHEGADAETIHCGPGTDTVYYDTDWPWGNLDKLYDCENRYREGRDF